MLKERGVKNAVEVGTDHGKYAQQLCEGIPGLKLCCVDPWVPYVEGTESHTQEEMNQIYEEAINRLIPYNCVIYKNTSMGAVEFFEDNSLDFAFIDGNHEYEHVLEDIQAWYEKVKPGGIIAGHDYKEDSINKYGVIEAVEKFTTDNNISPWFVLHVGGKLVDCWLMIKQP